MRYSALASHGMNVKRVALVISMVCATGIIGCRRVAVAPSELAKRVTISTCPPGIVPTDPNAPLATALLRVTFLVEPAVPDSTLMTIRLDGETTRSSIRVDPMQPMSFALQKGVYIVRTVLPGYTNVEGRVPLTAGCEATMSMIIRKDLPTSK